MMGKIVKGHVSGICRVRNEAHILRDTLDWYSGLCDSIYVLDDASTDNTRDIISWHPAVTRSVFQSVWEQDPRKRYALGGSHRGLRAGLAAQDGAEWILCFDADERLHLDQRVDIDSADAWRFRLWDYYITAQDANHDWRSRRYVGPEYRDILMLARVHSGLRFPNREPKNAMRRGQGIAGHVEHWGKAISVDDWDATCRYYRDHHPEPYSTKWTRRLGRAIHTKSSFGHPLVLWKDREAVGIPLTRKVEAGGIYQ